MNVAVSLAIPKGSAFAFSPYKWCRHAVLVIVIGGTSLLSKTGNVGEMHSNASVRIPLAQSVGRVRGRGLRAPR